MAELATIARPYAEAVFRLAKGGNALAPWSDRLAFIAAVLAIYGFFLWFDLSRG